MAEDTKAALGVAFLLVVGLTPSLVGLVRDPSRGLAAGAAGSAAMAVVFVVWTHRLASDLSRSRVRESALRDDLAALEETIQDQSRELRDAKSQDTGTDVLNRSAFLRHLDDAIARDARLGEQLALLVVDIEGFKALNIERGRIGGDAILKRVARALVAATRGSDFVGRLGGDEFGVVLNECEDPGPAVNRIIDGLKSAAGGENAVPIHVAIGAVTVEDPAAGVDVQELFRVADAALASVRGTGGSLCARRTLRADAERQSATA